MMLVQGVWVGWTGISDFSSQDSIPESTPEDPSPTSGIPRVQELEGRPGLIVREG